MEPDFNKYFSPNQPSSSILYNTSQTHPIIPSSQQYLFYKKYVSIHSEDRDIFKYPNASNFEIELPEDIINVSTISLANWTFPANYNVFSPINLNTTMTFKINNPFNPTVSSLYYSAIFVSLYTTQNYDYNIVIETGSYTPQQMTTELTNKFNSAVTQQIISFLNDMDGPSYDSEWYPQYLNAFLTGGGYTNFKIVYNDVSNKFLFGNICDGFILTNENLFKKDKKMQLVKFKNESFNQDLDESLLCGSRPLPNFSNWGLPANLSGSQVNWLEAPYKANLTGPTYFYIELHGQNCIDETSPYNLNTFTIQTNQTNGIVNSSFAKIPVPTSTITPQWFDRVSLPYKEYNPPAERIRKLKIKIRYHGGQLVNFGNCDYSLLLEFVILQPTPARTYTNSFKKPNMGNK